MKTTLLAGIFLFFIALPGWAQVVDLEKYSFTIQRTDSKIELDGILDEEAWKVAAVVDNFTMNRPTDSLPASSQSEVRVTYDKQNLYISAIMYDSKPEMDYTMTSLRRDFDFGRNDLFVVYIDPFNDQTNGFTFNVTPFNVQREGLMFNGQNVDTDWDNVWYSAVDRKEDVWTVEMAVPFKTLRFKDGADYWKINFGRNDLKHNEHSTWVPVPINFWISSLAYTGEMHFAEPLEKNGPNIAFIPYAAGRVTRDFEEGEDRQFGGDAGFDAKVALTSSLNLDITVNPDFSQVEVDQQQTNLNRFELFFPERRQFFLENKDLFAEFGFSPTRPFFSRRIGLVRDTADNLVPNRILAGLRLSGKVNNDWRVGLLNVTTQRDESIGVPTQNFTVATVQRKVFSRSNIAAIIVNRESINYGSEEGVINEDITAYNRVLGLEYNLQSSDNRWRGKAYYHHSFSPTNNNKNGSFGSFLSYDTRTFNANVGIQHVGENFNAEVGFVPRQNYFRIEPQVEYKIYPKNEKIIFHGPSVATEFRTDNNLELTDRRLRLRYSINFLNTSRLSFITFNEYIRLLDDFDPTNSDGEPLLAGEEFTYTRYGVSYDSDRRKRLTYDVTVFSGGFFNGDRHFFRTNIGYRFQPYGSFSMFFQYNRVDLPEPFSDADFFLIGPRLDVSFTDALFFTTFVQYNNQADNININSRLQWRFKPVSDVFLVYTDNYFPQGFGVKNRAVILKVSYWLNI